VSSRQLVLPAEGSPEAAASAVRWGRSEKLILAAAGLGVLHHADHVLRFDHSGWPFRPDVSPFTYSLLVYPVLLAVLVLRSRPWLRVALMSAVYVAVQSAHVLVEPPSHQYGTWADGLGQTPSGAHPPNLLHLASPVVGALSATLSVVLSLVTVAALVSLVIGARRARPPAAGDRTRPSVLTGRTARGG
jgi:hypothetical protein